jgi:hypothetical protein
MGSRKRSRPNTKAETPLQAHKDVGEIETAKAAVAPNNDGSAVHTSGTQESASGSSNPLVPDGNSVKVGSVTMDSLSIY